MTQCPVCKAKIKAETVCYRCKTNLTMLLRIEATAALLLEQSKSSILNSDYDRALQLVQQSRRLHHTPAAESLELFIRALQGDFQPVLEKLMLQ